MTQRHAKSTAETHAQASGRERILAAFDGRPGWPKPVGPAYPNGLLGDTVRRRYEERYRERMGSHDQVVLDHATDAKVWVAAWQDAYALLPDRPDWMTISVGRPHSGIDGAVEDVDQRIHEDEEDRRDRHDRLHREVLAGGDGFDEIAALLFEY